MKIIVDTSVWSLALRRDKQDPPAPVQELRHIIYDHRVQMIGPIRQELLSGICSESQFEKLRKHLESFPDLPIHTKDTPALQLGTDRLNQPPGSFQLRAVIGEFIAAGGTDFRFIQDNGY